MNEDEQILRGCDDNHDNDDDNDTDDDDRDYGGWVDEIWWLGLAWSCRCFGETSRQSQVGRGL